MLVMHLVAAYKTAREYKSLAPKSRDFYDLMITTCQPYLPPDTPLVRVNAEFVDSIFEQLTERHSLHRAVHVAKVFRRIWFIGMRRGLVASNPWTHMGLPATVASRETLWTHESLYAMFEACATHQLPHLAALIGLCYFLGQRPGDMMALKWRNFSPTMTYVQFRQQKTHKELAIMLPSELRAFLSNWSHVQRYNTESVITYANGKLCPSGSLRNDFRRMRQIAAINPNLQLRDLRRTALTELGESKATDSEIQSVGGHADPSIMHNVYIQRTLKMSLNAMIKRFPNDVRLRSMLEGTQ